MTPRRTLWQVSATLERPLAAFGIGRRPEPALAWKIVLGILLLYTASFFAFYPDVATADDEAIYLSQARLLVLGATRVTKIDAFTGAAVELEPSQYPVGTAALMAPFVALFGWRGAYLVPLLSVIGAVLLTARWIAEQGRSPAFASLVIAFPATLVMGRVAMSDAPSMALVTLGCWCFWRGIERDWPWWLAAGVIAGGSMVLRESNAVFFIPLFAGTVLRRERKCVALVVGGAVGVALRLLASQLAFGAPLYLKAPYYFAPATIMERLPLFATGLLVFVPGGLIFSAAYRGPRRPEIVTTVLGVFLFFLLQAHGMTASSLLKRTVIALRYFLPVLPIIAFATSESVPRLWRSVGDAGVGTMIARRVAGAALALSLLSLAGAAALVHPVFERWASTQSAIQEAIADHCGLDSVLVTNWRATRKFIRELDRRYLAVDRNEITVAKADDLARAHGKICVAFLDRADSGEWLWDAERSAAFIESVSEPLTLQLDRTLTSTDRLRIWHMGPAVGAPSPAASSPSPRGA
jgi:hypothetical protein